MEYDAGILVVLGILSVILFIYQSIKPLQLDKDVHTLGGSHFLLGDLPYLIKSIYRWPTISLKQNNHFKRTWAVELPNLPGLPTCLLIINDEDSLKHVLQDNFDNYVKGEVFQDWFKDFLGEGIFAVDGLKWKVHRKLMSH